MQKLYKKLADFSRKMKSPILYKTKPQLKNIPLVLSYYNFEDCNKENENYFLKPENIAKYFNVPKSKLE